MLKEKQANTICREEAEAQSINLLEAQLLKLSLPEQCDPLLKQSGPKLHHLAKLYKLGLCNFK